MTTKPNISKTYYWDMSTALDNYVPASTGQVLAASGVYFAEELNTVPVNFHRSITEPSVQIFLHSHSFVEIIYCRKAAGVEYLVGSERYLLQPGDIIIIPSGVAHRPLFTDSMTAPFVRDELWGRSDLVDYLGRKIPDSLWENRRMPYLFRTDDSKWEHIGDLFQKGIKEYLTKDIRWEEEILAYGLLLLSEITRALLDEETNLLKKETSTLFDRLLKYVEENYHTQITLEDTARVFFVSRSTINRTFQKRIGTSFYHYVTQRRLIEATTLISSEISLESVGEKVGFADYPTFYRSFKKEYGMSPLQFKQKQKEN